MTASGHFLVSLDMGQTDSGGTPDDFRYVLGLQERVSVGMADVYA